MVRSCSAYGCTNRYIKGSNIQFYPFPLKNNKLNKKWILKVKRKNFVPTIYSTICSAHFCDDDYLDRPGRASRVLKPDAFPSIFPSFPEYYQPAKKKERRSVAAKLENRSAECTESIQPSEPEVSAASYETPNSDSLNLLPPDEERILQRENSSVSAESIQPFEPEASAASQEFTPNFDSLNILLPDEKRIQPIENLSTQEISTQTEGSQSDHAKILQLTEKNAFLLQKVKILNQTVRRRNKTISNLRQLLTSMKNQGLIENETSAVLTSHFGESSTTAEIFNNEIANRVRKPRGRRYSQEMKKFALTLHYHSAKAYKYCRKLLCLPSPSALRNWLSSVNAEPGFFQEVFDALKSFPDSDKDCVLMLDGMSIRKQLIWDTKAKSYLGFCDYGSGTNLEAKKTEAKEALVMMVVGLRRRWKWPIGYFLTDTLPGSALSELLKTALHLSHASTLRVRAITADGHASNMKAFEELGCKLNVNDPDEMVNYFKHPACDDMVYIILDACHMLKLARNTLGEFRQLKCGNDIIDWKYFVSLNEYQERLGLKFANRLSKTHVEYANNKMKVKLAAQTFSSSVADAFDMLRDAGKKDFANCGATVFFIRQIDRLFDFLNSRTPFTKSGFKKPIYFDQIERKEKSMMEIVRYLYSLTDLQGEPIFSGRRRTFIIGFAAAVRSICSVVRNVLSDANGFKYLLTYSLSQDHLELFFSRIRRRFGNNNNPNVRQFKTAMKQLLLKNNIDSSPSANVIAFDDACGDGNDKSDEIFEIKWSRSKKIDLFDDTFDLGGIHEEEEEEQIEQALLDQEEMFHRVNLLDSSEGERHVDYILHYVAGFVVRSIKKNKLKCESCAQHLEKRAEDHTYGLWNNDRIESFTRLKDRGGLVKPSMEVFKIIKCTEGELKRATGNWTDDRRLCQKNLYSDVLRSVTRRMFHTFQHVDICETEDFGGPSHRIILVKLISSTYMKIRLHAYAKFRREQTIVSKRNKYNKLTLFSNT